MAQATNLQRPNRNAAVGRRDRDNAFVFCLLARAFKCHQTGVVCLKTLRRAAEFNSVSAGFPGSAMGVFIRPRQERAREMRGGSGYELDRNKMR